MALGAGIGCELPARRKLLLALTSQPASCYGVEGLGCVCRWRWDCEGGGVLDFVKGCRGGIAAEEDGLDAVDGRTRLLSGQAGRGAKGEVAQCHWRC